ncbi:outer membrane protein assembly factor BamD [Neobacillus dielmonensis]|uniref:hypothetical protein n=1 Tax=Neobacillus dielmonensis TaxID=1347369 RepID=UPI0005A8CAE1|nr:hypothetical protein [Neobacillus dielmonensis]
MNKKTFLISGMAALLTFGGLAGCGDGVDQDNGMSDGAQKDAIDSDTKKEASELYSEAKQNLQDIKQNVEEAIKDEAAKKNEN